MQDLVSGSGYGLEAGDSVELMYTGWLLTDASFGVMFDSNASADRLLRFKIGKGKVIKGLDVGVIGLKKDGIRLVIVPPQLGYGTRSKGKIPPSATLIYEIKAVRIKLARERDASDVITTESSVESSSESCAVSAQSESTAVETKSTDYSQTTGKPDKAKLISRIAKMGQAMFPVTEPTSTSPSPTSPSRTDTEQETASEAGDTASDEKVSASSKPALAAKPLASPGSRSIIHQPSPVMSVPTQLPPGVHPYSYPVTSATSHLALYQPSLPMLPQNYAQPSFGGFAQHPVVQSTPAVPPVSMAMDSSVPLLLSESRTQTIEMRMSLSKVADKVDRIYDKLEHMCQNQNQQLSTTATVPLTSNMDSALLLHNLQQIIEDNSRLKREVAEKNAKIEAQNEQISDLLNKSQKFLEQSNTLLEQRTDTLRVSSEQNQAKLLALEQDKAQLAKELSSLTSELSNARMELGSSKTREGELEAQLKTVLTEVKEKQELLDTMKASHTEKEKECEKLLEKHKVDSSKREELEAELRKLSEEMASLLTRKNALEQSQHEQDVKLEEVKQVYQKEIAELKAKLELASSSNDNKQIEELDKEWQKKYDSLLEESQRSQQTSTADLQKRNEHLEELVKVTEQKYESLWAQAATMKQRYENRITELENQQGAAPVGEVTKQQVITKVKQVMNTVYHELKKQFEVDNTYRGDEINGNIMTVIKKVTLRMLQEDEEELSAKANEDRVSATASEDAVKKTDHWDTEEPAEQECIVAATVAQMSAAPPPTCQGDGRQLVAEAIQAAVVTPCGDKGSPSYAKELSREHVEEVKQKEVSEQVVSDVIRAVVAPITGDKGNPHYAKELKEARKDNIEEPIIESAVSQTTMAAHSQSHDHKSEGCVEIPADIISPKVAYPTGGSGNPYRTAELRKHAKESIEEVKQKEVSEQVVSDVIHAVVAPITGDKGNLHHAKELEEARKEHEREEPVVCANVSQVSALPPGSHLNDDEANRQQHELITDVIKPVVAHSTGDKGNPYYAAELNRHEPEVVSEQRAAAEVVTEIIQSVVAPSTGDKGNPYYAAELAEKAKEHEELFPSEQSESANKKMDRKETEEKRTSVRSEKNKKTDESLESSEASEEEKDKKASSQVEQEKGPNSGDDKKSVTSEEEENDEKHPTSVAKEVKKTGTSTDREKDETNNSSKSGNDDKSRDSASHENTHGSVLKSEGEKGKSLEGEAKTKDAIKVTGSTKAKDTAGTSESHVTKETASSKDSSGKGTTKKRLEDSDDDLKPKPPPLFDDDDDDDDTNWLK